MGSQTITRWRWEYNQTQKLQQRLEPHCMTESATTLMVAGRENIHFKESHFDHPKSGTSETWMLYH